MNKKQVNPYPLITKLELQLPAWTSIFLADKISKNYLDEKEQMTLTLELLESQITSKTGGPFAAIVFDADGWILSVGVNLVVPENNSTAHAEMLALQLAQKNINNYSLSSVGCCTLASSSQPCAQCCGAGVWAGIGKLLVASSAADTEEILGFDEGPIHPNWIEEYEKRNIIVVKDLMREQASEIMRKYQGIIY